jgi:outer membrane protein OmpA-like peptidoglycan-associated protein
MAFNYEKNKNHDGNDSFWTSYSDLFLGLSTIFLLLYVMASLRTGTDAIKSQVDNQKLSTRVEELENQLKMYESVKKNYMDTAAKDEQEEYQDLMDKLTLLQEEAKSEKDRLAQEALENGKKAQALNKYQQMVRNILNANKVAKSRIVTRNEIITEQDTQIDEQQKDITTLKSDINAKTQAIAEGNRQIAASKVELDKKIKLLQASYKKNKMTKAAYNKQMQSIKSQNEARIADLQTANQQYNQQLAQANQELNQLNSELEGTQAALSQKTVEASKLHGKLAVAAGEANSLKGQIGSLKSNFASQQAEDKKAFDAEMERLKLDAAQRTAREAKFRAEAEGKARALQSKVSGLEGQLASTEGDLARAKAEMDTRKSIAKEIKEGFAKAGVKADIDMQTGDVVLDFGDAYFESNSANLKPEMKNIIEKAMPIYSKSLFGNPKVASQIKDVEIVGFASPTYQGRYIDPLSTKPEDKSALKYNMDLSYQRANAIFKHLVDGKVQGFKNQQELMSLMKVSGRSFLDIMNVQKRSISSAVEFCKVNDCKKAQRVIVRFSVDGRKKGE